MHRSISLDVRDGYGYFLEVTFWTSDCQGDLAPVVAEELKQVGCLGSGEKKTQAQHSLNASQVE